MNRSKRYLIELAQQGKRIDGRGLNEWRKPGIKLGISKYAEGSAMASIGKTKVIVGVKMDVGTPYPDNPDEGGLIVNAELSPMASPEFELGPPDERTIELARVVDRAIRESKMIDLKKLFIEEGKVWVVIVDIFAMNDDGNLVDAAMLGAIASLQMAKIPRYEEGRVLYGKLSDEKLPITKIPMTCTFVKIGNHILLDPNNVEESVCDCKLTIATYGNTIHAMHKSGPGTFTKEEINECIKTSISKGKIILKNAGMLK